jgi:hypothetical protein
MIAVELETSVLNHKIEVTSDSLPERAAKARVIVLYEASGAKTAQPQKMDDILENAFGCLSHGKSQAALDAEIGSIRAEWLREWER